MAIRVIAISGKAGSGKDTSAVMMADILQHKGERVLITHYADLLKYICRTFFGWDGKKDENGRRLLQYVGTDVVRKTDPDFWVNFVRDVMLFFDGRWDYVLIPDVRFPNELTQIQNAGFNVIHVRLQRDEAQQGMPEEQKNHPSETAMDDCDPNILLVNDGDLQELRSKIAELIEGGVL